MYELLPSEYFPKTIYINPEKSFEKVLMELENHSFSYPFIVKPEVGMEGILFRKIDHEEHLAAYHRKMQVDYIIQEFVDYPLEVGLFYYRHPAEVSGAITALFCKKFPSITGDGFASIKEIVEKEKPEIKEELSKLSVIELDRVLAKGECRNLSFIGNRYHGTTFHDLSGEIDQELLQLFDRISQASGFYYGRYDIKCASVEEMKKGSGFSILEFNGAGSIPNHIYTGKYSLTGAYKEIAFHWKVLYRISRFNHSNGHPYWSLLKGWRYLREAKKHFRFLRKCDQQLLLHAQPESIIP